MMHSCIYLASRTNAYLNTLSILHAHEEHSAFYSTHSVQHSVHSLLIRNLNDSNRTIIQSYNSHLNVLSSLLFNFLSIADIK